jgi:hypothetical protein
MGNSGIVEARVVARPYIVFGALAGWAPLLLLYGVITTPSERGGLLFGFVLGVFLLSWLFAAFWCYRIGVCEGLLVERKFLMRRNVVPISSITRWSHEVGLSNRTGWTNLRNLRPFRRITIYYSCKDLKERFVDISLVHFSPEDVNRILMHIKCVNPGLGQISGFKWCPSKK